MALSEYGCLEMLLTRALPECHLRFRNLAWMATLSSSSAAT